MKWKKIKKENITFGTSAQKYELYYGIHQDVIDKSTPRLTFKDIGKQLKPKKNKDLFKKIVEKHNKL